MPKLLEGPVRTPMPSLLARFVAARPGLLGDEPTIDTPPSAVTATGRGFTVRLAPT
jgi:hypothetical protein